MPTIGFFRGSDGVLYLVEVLNDKVHKVIAPVCEAIPCNVTALITMLENVLDDMPVDKVVH